MASGLAFVAAWSDRRVDKSASRADFDASDATLLPREAVPEGMWKAYLRIPLAQRDMAQWRAMERLVAHHDMKAAYRTLARQKPTDAQWQTFMFAALQAWSAGHAVRDARVRLKAAEAAMVRIAEHAAALDAAIAAFWESATTDFVSPDDLYGYACRNAVLAVPVDALTYPGARENDNPCVQTNQLPYERPPLRGLLQRLAAAAHDYRPAAKDAVMNSALRGDRTDVTAFVLAFDASVAVAPAEHRINVGPSPLATLALVLLREAHRFSATRDKKPLENYVKQIRHRARSDPGA